MKYSLVIGHSGHKAIFADEAIARTVILEASKVLGDVRGNVVVEVAPVLAAMR